MATLCSNNKYHYMGMGLQRVLTFEHPFVEGNATPSTRGMCCTCLIEEACIIPNPIKGDVIMASPLIGLLLIQRFHQVAQPLNQWFQHCPILGG